MAPKEKAEAQTFSFEEVACMVAAMNAAGVVLGAKHYGLMAKLDGTRTTSSFEHKFRAVKARGKELATELGDVSVTPKSTKTTNKTATSTGKKRGSELITCGPIVLLIILTMFRYAGKNTVASDDDEVSKTPSEKAKTDVKTEPSEESSDVADNSADGFGLNGGFFDNAITPQ